MKYALLSVNPAKLCAILSFLLLAGSLFAKRAAPQAVTPVSYNEIKYSAPNDNGRIGYVQASDAAGKLLFRITVFHTKINPSLDEDVQWVFITDMKLAGRSLLVKDEKSRCYVINLETKAVERKWRC